MTKRTRQSREPRDIYGGVDPRELPTYTVAEAAHHLRLASATLGAWARGPGRLIVPAKTKPMTLSFFNLMEAHVLAAIRRKHRVPMQKVRKALTYVSSALRRERPLIEQVFRTDGVDLFVEHYGQIVSASENGQSYIRDTIELTLERVEHDATGLVARLHPWSHRLDEPMHVVIDPRRAFGRPVVVGSNVPAEVLAERFAAGDTLAALAEDYQLDVGRIEYAVQWAVRAA
ncbi:MAG: DUF433 domain-containing protein [Planctomycetes bacterium]|nr:DUF433 domain-containing protein [Planctomycetota bacterium]